MLTPEQIVRFNARLMERLSGFLNLAPDFIQASAVEELVKASGVTPELAYSLLLAAALGLDVESNAEDKALFDNYFRQMIHRLDPEAYQRDAYYRSIELPEAHLGTWELTQQRYQPFEAFVCNDLEAMPDGRVVPQLGYFEREFTYPAVLEDGREWMVVTPNEIETMKPAIRAASGAVLTYGLGLGYFACLVSEKAEVSSVTVVERDESVLRLFERFLLPQFGHAEKIELVHDDAFAHAERHLSSGRFDLVFTDLWHDPVDGVAPYLRMKQLERLSPRTRFAYWIERTLQHYL